MWPLQISEDIQVKKKSEITNSPTRMDKTVLNLYLSYLKILINTIVEDMSVNEENKCSKSTDSPVQLYCMFVRSL